MYEAPRWPAPFVQNTVEPETIIIFTPALSGRRVRGHRQIVSALRAQVDSFFLTFGR